MNIAQSIAQAAQVVLSHQLFEHVVVREQSRTLAPSCALRQFLQLVIVHDRRRIVRPEKMSELGMLAKKDRARFSDRVLPLRERCDRHRMMMPRDRLRVVANLQSERVEPVRELDVFPRRGGKRRVERMRSEQLAIDRDVRRVEKIEREDRKSTRLNSS